MHTTYKSWRNWKSCALGAAVLTALLSTTACDPAGTDNGTGTAPSAPSATSVPPGSTDSTQPSEGASTGDGPTATATAACDDASISVDTTLYARDSARHLLLTATNTGDTECALHRYPIVRFDDGREDQVGPMESEMTPVTVGPGEKAYAGMLLFRTGAPTEAVETITVSLQGRVPDADPDSAPIKAPLPAEADFLNIDDNPAVSYWNADRKTAEGYMFKAAGGN